MWICEKLTFLPGKSNKESIWDMASNPFVEVTVFDWKTQIPSKGIWTCVCWHVPSLFPHYFFFSVFKILLVLIILYSLKTYCYTFDLYLFVLGRDRFFTIYICFKETLFFNFSYKLFNRYFSLPQSMCQFRISVKK